MKKRSTTLALITAAMMLTGMISGCNSSTNSSSNASSQPTSNTSSTDSTTDSTNNNTSESEAPVAGEVSLPLTEEPVTFTVWMPMDTNLANVVDSMGENQLFIELENRTGVHLEFSHPASGQEATAYNLMIASGDLKDIMYGRTGVMAYPDGLDAGVADGYFIDLTDLIEQYAPNYQKVRTSTEFLSKASMTDGGLLAAMYQIQQEPQGAWFGYYVRRDWLEKCNLDIPVTYADWEEMLTAFKDECGATAPLHLGPNGYDDMSNALNAGYGVNFSFYQVDGTVKYGPIEEGWRDYLTMMNKWYNLGLIDPDYMSGAGVVDNNMVVTNKTGAFAAPYTRISMLESMNTECDLYPVEAPVLNEGEHAKIRMNDSTIGCYYTISTSCENPELAVKWIDYLYSEEGAELCNYGIEGDTFNYNSEGEVEFTDKIMANPDGMTFSQAVSYYLMPPARPCWQDWTRELATVPEKDQVCYEIWGNTTTDYNIPTGVSMTADENAEYAKIYADVNSLVQEKTSGFITGQLNLTTDFDAFVEQIKALNIDRAIEIQQAALDRFYER